MRAPWVTEQQTAPAKAKREYNWRPLIWGAGGATALWTTVSNLVDPVDGVAVAISTKKNRTPDWRIEKEETNWGKGRVGGQTMRNQEIEEDEVSFLLMWYSLILIPKTFRDQYKADFRPSPAMDFAHLVMVQPCTVLCCTWYQPPVILDFLDGPVWDTMHLPINACSCKS